MWSLFVLALCGLLGTLASAQVSYYFTSGLNIKAGQPYEIQLNVQRALSQPLTVLLTLKQNNSYPYRTSSRYYFAPKNVSQKTVNITEPGVTTVTLDVPLDLHDPRKRYYTQTSLEVNCTGAFEAYHSAALIVEANAFNIYVQSDKAMYKPGDLVRFRTFTTDAELKPYLGKYNITITDPGRKNVLKIWRNIQADSGVLSKTFQLSDQPPLGKWEVQIKNELGEKGYNFNVEEYVLPKFKLSVEMPHFLVVEMDKFTASIIVQYTFGKPVKGNITLMLGIPADGYTCRESWQDPPRYRTCLEVCPRKKIMAELDKDGKYDLSIPMSEMPGLLPFSFCSWNGTRCYKTRESLKYSGFYVWVNATESATGVTLSGEGSIRFSAELVSTKFIGTPDYYKPGLPFLGYVQLTQPDGSPLPEGDLIKADGTRRAVNLTITYICQRQRRYDPTVSLADRIECNGREDTRLLQVSPGGVMAFEVPVNSSDYQYIALKAEFRDKYQKSSQITKYVSPFKTKDNYGLRILTEMEDGALKPGSTAVFDVTAQEEIDRLHFDIIAKGSIVYSADKVYDEPSKNQKFRMDIDEDFARKMAPTPRIVVFYVRANGELIGDSVSFNVDSELSNQVEVDFSTNQTRPGEDMSITVKAYRGSFVGLTVVDQSVKLLAGGNDITKDMVDSSLRGMNPNTPYYPALFARGGRWGGMCCGCWPFQMSGSNVAELFTASGYLIFTDALIYTPSYGHPAGRPGPQSPSGPSGPRGESGSVGERGQRGEPGSAGERGEAGPAGPSGPSGPRGPSGPSGPRGASGPSTNNLEPVERVRTEFPETWIWVDALVGPDGTLVHRAKSPDTITSWTASGFAMSKEKGLGVSNAARMTVFKPFFISLTLPYALIRGEQFGLKATIFNYLAKPQDVTVTLRKSKHYNVLVIGQEVSRTAKQTITVPASDAQTVIFWIIPTQIGNMNITLTAQSSQAADALKRMIPVRPEGTPQEHTESVLLALGQESIPFVREFKANFPPKDLVEDSQRVKVTAVGDIMGPLVSNLGNLVRMPYGCGEQNMVNFVPNIHVIRYMNAANLNMPEMRERALSYIERGYQRELTYKRNDGSFSAFGDRNSHGSTWLTAFVLKSFAQAVPYMEVNERHIEDAIRFLLRQQGSDGAFNQPGYTSSYLVGGADSRETLAAYVAIALATARDANYTDMAFKDRIKRLVDAPLQEVTQYLNSSMTVIMKDPYAMAITTYAYFLAKIPQADVALEKLNDMAFTKDGMQYWANEAEDIKQPWWYYYTKTFDIEMTSYAMLSNLLYASPSKALPTVKWLLSKSNGQGGYRSTQDTCLGLEALTEFATRTYYAGAKQKLNIRVSTEIKDFDFDPITPENSIVTQIRELPYNVDNLTIVGNGSGTALVQMIMNYNILDPDISKDLMVKVDSVEDILNNKVKVDVCFQWLNKGKSSGMGILEITPLSGYEVDTDTLMDDYKDIQRQEKNGQTLVTYWEKFEEKLTCLNVTLLKTSDVSNHQESEVRVYSYYEPEKEQTLFYLPANMKSTDPCHACPACCTKDGIQVLEPITIDSENKDQTGRDNNGGNGGKNNAHNDKNDKNMEGSASTVVPSVVVGLLAAIFAVLQ